MPFSRALMTRARKSASANRRYAFRAPELQGFRDWVANNGYGQYQRYLVSHPVVTAREAYAEFGSILRFSGVRAAAQPNTVLSEPVNRWAISGPIVDFPGSSCLVVVLVGALAVAVGDYRAKLLGALAVFLSLGTLAELYVCYHADAVVVARHAVCVGILLRLGVIAVIALMLSFLVRAAKSWLFKAKNSLEAHRRIRRDVTT
jgi:hypothetical protein